MSARRSECPINFALELLGDRWTLLVIRDLAIRGMRYYSELLQGGEGISTNILADRLGKLETGGIVVRQTDPEDGRRTLYTLTPRGADLVPLLLEMIVWGGQHDPQSPVSAEFLAEARSDREAVIARLRSALTVR